MKKTILILVYILFSVSCVKENRDNCPDCMAFTFLYNESTQEYDEMIGNDVHLRIYVDDMLYSTHVIPYAKIKGGKQVTINKEITGRFDIVAWAVPADDNNAGEIPEPAKRKSEQKLAMKYRSDYHVYQSIGVIYLGTYSFNETDITKRTNIPVNMEDCIGQFTATIYDVPELYEPGQDEPVTAVIKGVMSELGLDLHPQGEDASVYARFTQKEGKSILKTDTNGLLPSDEEQTLIIRFYKGDNYQGMVRTDVQVSRGDVIHIDVYRHRVTIVINGWRTFEESVEWI